MNQIEKIHALMVSDKVRVWHYHCARPPLKPFVYWLMSEPEDRQGRGFDTFSEMIESAYAHIDPLLLPTPDQCPGPPAEN